MALFFVIAYILCILMSAWALKNLSFSRGMRSPGPYWVNFLFYLPVMILPSLLAINVFEISFFRSIDGVSQSRLTEANMWLVYAVVLLCMSLVFFDKVTGRFKINSREDNDTAVLISVSMVVIFILLIIYSKTGTLPILEVFNPRVDLGELRIDFTREASFSPYYRTILEAVSYFGAAYAGSILGVKKSYIKYSMLAVSLIGLAWYGAKAPPLNGILVYYFSSLWFSNKKLNVIRITMLLVVVLSLLWLLFALVFSDLGSDELILRIARRLFFSTMHGYYYTFGLIEPDPKYVLNWLPLTGAFGVDVAPLARDMMVFIYGDKSTNNQLSSIFLMDAWGALGYVGLVLSPIMVAFSFIVSLKLIAVGLYRVVGARFLVSTVYAFVVTNPVFLSFSMFVFFRVLIIYFIIFLSFSLVYKLVSSVTPR